jgi:flavorubredoxin
VPLIEEKDWDTAIEEFNQLTQSLVEKNIDKKKIKYIIEQHIGKGRTVAELDPSELNTDIVLMVIDDLRDLAK